MGGGSKFWDLFGARGEAIPDRVVDAGCVQQNGDFEAIDDVNSNPTASIPSAWCGNRTDGTLKAAVDLLKGSRLAVDLSQWIVQGESGHSESGDNAFLKTIVHRTVAIRSTRFGNIRPVFVADPNQTKHRAQLLVNTRYNELASNKENNEHASATLQNRRSRHFVAKCNKSRKVLELLGCPVIVAEGEAERLCAQLNRVGLVDGCISQDGDCLCFGAKRVFKVFCPCRQHNGWPIEYFDLQKIQETLGLGREQLVAAMLLLGCDFCDGVQHTGTNKTLRFLKEYGSNVLEKIKAWVGGKDAGVHLYEDPHLEGRRQPVHCSRCGRHDCESRKARTKSCLEKEQTFLCECAWCEHVRNWESQRFLRTMIQRLQQLDLPLTESVINLFLQNIDSLETERLRKSIKWTKPDVRSLQKTLQKLLHWDPAHTEKVLLPMSTAHFFDDPNTANYQPVAVVDQSVLSGRQTYHIRWRRSVALQRCCQVPPPDLVTQEGAEFIEGSPQMVDLLARFCDPARAGEQAQALIEAASETAQQKYLDHIEDVEPVKEVVISKKRSCNAHGALKDLVARFRATSDQVSRISLPMHSFARSRLLDEFLNRKSSRSEHIPAQNKRIFVDSRSRLQNLVHRSDFVQGTNRENVSLNGAGCVLQHRSVKPPLCVLNAAEAECLDQAEWVPSRRPPCQSVPGDTESACKSFSLEPELHQTLKASESSAVMEFGEAATKASEISAVMEFGEAATVYETPKAIVTASCNDSVERVPIIHNVTDFASHSNGCDRTVGSKYSDYRGGGCKSSNAKSTSIAPISSKPKNARSLTLRLSLGGRPRVVLRAKLHSSSKVKQGALCRSSHSKCARVCKKSRSGRQRRRVPSKHGRILGSDGGKHRKLQSNCPEGDGTITQSLKSKVCEQLAYSLEPLALSNDGNDMNCNLQDASLEEFHGQGPLALSNEPVEMEMYSNPILPGKLEPEMPCEPGNGESVGADGEKMPAVKVMRTYVSPSNPTVFAAALASALEDVYKFAPSASASEHDDSQHKAKYTIPIDEMLPFSREDSTNDYRRSDLRFVREHFRPLMCQEKISASGGDGGMQRKSKAATESVTVRPIDLDVRVVTSRKNFMIGGHSQSSCESRYRGGEALGVGITQMQKRKSQCFLSSGKLSATHEQRALKLPRVSLPPRQRFGYGVAANESKEQQPALGRSLHQIVRDFMG